MFKKRFCKQRIKGLVFILFLMWVLAGASINARSDDFSIIVLPDTQFYPCKHWTLLDEQIDWIINYRDVWNIVYVAHVGDIVECGNTIYDIWFDPNWNMWRGCQMFDPVECTGHWPIPDEPYPGDELREWKITDDVFSKLEDPLPEFPYGIPYGLAVGNHDQFPPGNPYGNTTSSYNLYFGVDRFAGRPYYGGSYEENNNDNHYDIFTAGDIELIVIYLEHNKYLLANDPVLDWADGLLGDNPGRKGIIVLHDMLQDPEDCNLYGGWRGRGQIVFDRLKHNTNLFLMLCGHVGDGQSYRVDYPNGQDGNVVYTILSDYQGRGSVLPDSLGGGYLRIMKFSPSNNRIYVKSYSPFQNSWLTDCANEFELPLTNQYLHIISPNGGENWTYESIQNITWNYSTINYAEKIRLVLMENDVPLGTIVENIQVNANIYAWTVGNYLTGAATTGNTYKIRIETMDQTYSDDTDSNFSILNPSITLTAPNGGEQWEFGSTQTITWTAADILGNLRINLFDKNNVSLGSIASNLGPSAGSHTWTVGTLNTGTTVPPDTGYTIKIKDMDTGVYDYSDAPFNIYNFTLTSPNGGELWKFGSTQLITWNAPGITENLRIQLFKDGVLQDIIASNLDPATGSYPWTVGGLVGGVTVSPATGYTIKARAIGTPIIDFSNAPFTIYDLTLTSPNGGETWTLGTTQTITWTSGGVTGTVKITLWDSGGTKVGNVVSGIDVSLGTYSWTVGNLEIGTAGTGTGYIIEIKIQNTTIKDAGDAGFSLN